MKKLESLKNKADSKENIQKRFGFSELQAEAIVMLQLYKLSTTDIQALLDEKDTLNKEITRLELILSNERILLKTIKSELQEVQTLLPSPRRTELEAEIETIKIDEKDLISDEQTYVAITKDGYVKRASLRSVVASKEVGLKENDAMLYEEELNTLDTLLLFTNLGQYIYLPVYKIEEQKWRDLGVYINNIVPTSKGEIIIRVLKVSDFSIDRKITYLQRGNWR